MKNTSGFRLIPLAVLVLAGAVVATRYGRIAPRYVLAQALAGTPERIDLDGSVESLGRCARECAEVDARISRLLLELIEGARSAGEPNLEAAAAGYREILNLLVEHDRPEEFARLFPGARIMASNMGYLSVGRDFGAAADVALETMLKRHPKHPGLLMDRAVSLQSTRADLVTKLAAYRDWLRVDPGNSGALRSYDALKRDYAKPRCEGAEVAPGIEMYLNDPKPSEGESTSMRDGTQNRYRTEKPMITSDDVLSIEYTEDESGRFAVSINLSPEGARVLEGATDSHIGSNIALIFDGSLVTNPTISSRIPGGRFQISLGAASTAVEKATLEHFCRHTEQRELPAELRL